MSQKASRSSQGGLGSSEGSSRGALGELLGSSRGALGDLSRRQTLYFQKCMVFHLFYNKSGNLCYHGTGSEERAREAVRGQQKGMSMQEHCNVYDIGDRMQSKQ